MIMALAFHQSTATPSSELIQTSSRKRCLPQAKPLVAERRNCLGGFRAPVYSALLRVAKHIINFLHYPFCPLHSRRYQIFLPALFFCPRPPAEFSTFATW